MTKISVKYAHQSTFFFAVTTMGMTAQ